MEEMRLLASLSVEAEASRFLLDTSAGGAHTCVSVSRFAATAAASAASMFDAIGRAQLVETVRRAQVCVWVCVVSTACLLVCPPVHSKVSIT